MNILKPNGEVYMHISVNRDMLKLTPARYNSKYSMVIDVKAIPQLIASLQEIQNVKSI